MRRTKRDAAATAADSSWHSVFVEYVVSGGDDEILDFDSIYGEVVGMRGSEKLTEVLKGLDLTTVNVALEESLRSLLSRLTRSACNRALRFLGCDLAGRASRTLVALGVRTATNKVTAHVLARFSMRIMLALGTTASGVGFVIGVIELLGALLDFMLLFGWDPGNYNSEFTNEAFDDIAISWEQQRQYCDIVDMDPYVTLEMFLRDSEGVAAADVDGRGDACNHVIAPTKRLDSLCVPRSKFWFFEPFDLATKAIIEDATGGGDGENARLFEHTNTR